MEKLAGIILAAGLSSRMGDFKPLLEIGGQSMIRRVAALLQNAGADPVIVVTGHRHEDLTAHLAGCGVCFVHNPNYASTQQLDSLRLALMALPKDCERVLVTPADIPLVKPDTVKSLLSAEGDFIRPRRGERTGHPVLLSAKLIPWLLRYNGPGGLKGAIAHSGCAVRDISVEDPGVLMDNDTPNDFRQTLYLFEEGEA